ncbi:ParA family protein [Brevibacillus dissolubilis]|uniref:ParA family protein n=1 Tax=Brevibacillus dissolubilis TaxID=1844116 RepID=UPI001117466A|nr:ParA family protein [Brevibacillus dissolubilis]
MGKIICIMNQKGGVGKTTTTLNLGAGLRQQGRRVLLVDLDPQASLTSAVGVQHRTLTYTLYDLLKGEAEWDDVMIERNGIPMLPSSVSLSGADAELSLTAGREALLKSLLATVQDDYDFILIDCPPNLGLLTVNALTASDEILIPMQAEYLPLDAMSYLFETIEIVRERLNAALRIAGIVITKYDARQRLQREVVDVIRNHFGDQLFQTFIRSNVALAEAPSFGQDIFTYKPNSTGARDYAELCQELMSGGLAKV